MRAAAGLLRRCLRPCCRSDLHLPLCARSVQTKSRLPANSQACLVKPNCPGGMIATPAINNGVQSYQVRVILLRALLHRADAQRLHSACALFLLLCQAASTTASASRARWASWQGPTF